MTDSSLRLFAVRNNRLCQLMAGTKTGAAIYFNTKAKARRFLDLLVEVERIPRSHLNVVRGPDNKNHPGFGKDPCGACQAHGFEPSIEHNLCKLCGRTSQEIIKEHGFLKFGR